MKKVIKLSEEKLGEIISLIMEQVKLEDYEEEDFIEGFLITFRQWITEKLGDESKKYPLSSGPLWLIIFKCSSLK